MAVYTELSNADLAAVLKAYGLPKLDRATPIPEGSINTNYRVEAGGTPYFLRHSTVRSEADLAFEAEVLDALTKEGLAAPVLRKPEGGAASMPLGKGRVSLFEWMPGEELTRDRFTVAHASALGAQLAKMHLALKAVRGSRDNPYGPDRVRGWLKELKETKTDLGQVPEELSRAIEIAMSDTIGALKTGVIHADLFIDNVKWTAPDKPVFFDFEMACRDALALDVAITLNAWAFDGTKYMPEHARAFITAYQAVRPFAGAERHRLWNEALFGAVRYAASRIRDFHLSKLPADKLTKKDYRTYVARTRELLKLRREGFLSMLGL